MRRGALTVMLSLVLTIMLSLILTVIEGARISAIRMKFECVADIGMDSVLAEYHRELLRQYDLLFVDMSYGGTSPSIAATQSHLKTYMQKNYETGQASGWFGSRDFLAMDAQEASITEYSIASDQGGEVLKRQVTDYMRDYPDGLLLDAVSGWVSDIKVLEGRDIEGERHGYEAQISEIGLPVQEVEEGVFEEVPLNNPADVANATRSSGVLNLVLENTQEISKVKVDLSEYISARNCMQGTGVCAEAEELTGAANDLVFQEYLFRKCGFYGEELEKSLLKYQIEYIIAGEASDWMNLEEVAKKLLLWREVSNVMYIMSDSAKIAEAEAMAAALTAVTLQPALFVPVQYTILFAWAYVESLMDVRTLLSGGKVPLFKTAQDWKCGINSILDVRGSLSADAGENQNGLSYEEYLRVMLFLMNDKTRTMRAMDIMEMDIRTTPGNAHFRMDGCFDTFRAELSVSSRYGYTYRMQRLYGYY